MGAVEPYLVTFYSSLCILSSLCFLHCSSGEVIELKCNPNYDTSQIVNLPYNCIIGFSCFYENIQADANTKLVINFDETNYSLDCIGFANTSLGELPSNLFNKYQAINSIYASSMGLTVLHKNTFQNASNMYEINLSGNEIKVGVDFLGQ